MLPIAHLPAVCETGGKAGKTLKDKIMNAVIPVIANVPPPRTRSDLIKITRQQVQAGAVGESVKRMIELRVEPSLK